MPAMRLAADEFDLAEVLHLVDDGLDEAAA
jgi:hypothetical protein